MKNKGFTLVELLGVIIIIGIIALITVPTVLSGIKSSKQKAYDQQISTIKLALQNWKSSNPSLLPKEGESIYLTINQLKRQAYLDNDLVNPLTDGAIPNDMELIIINNNGYQYSVLEDTGTPTPAYDDPTPFLAISEEVVIMKVGDEYIKPSLALISKDGNITSYSSEPVISGDGTAVDTSKPGVYHLKYNVNIDGIAVSAFQNVIIR